MNARCSLICSLPTPAERLATFPADEAAEVADPGEIAAAMARLGPVDHAWTSPALRARQTAAALGLSVDNVAKVAVDEALRDCDYGRWTGRRLVDIQREEPEAAAAWLNEPATAPHGGESIAGLLDRVATWLDARLNEGGRDVAVTHPAVVRAAVVHALQASPRSFWRLDAEPLCIADLRAFGGRWTLRSIGACR